jgi:hypothetical protein
LEYSGICGTGKVIDEKDKMTQRRWSAFCQPKNVKPVPEKFGMCWLEKISPLIWRIPILVWSLSIISWSVAFFWGPLDMFLLYMTHWGLVFIAIESVFGIIVTVKKPDLKYFGKRLLH